MFMWFLFWSWRPSCLLYYEICPTINETIKDHLLTLFGCFLLHPMSLWDWATWRLKLRSFASCVIEWIQVAMECPIPGNWIFSLVSCTFLFLGNHPSHGGSAGGILWECVLGWVFGSVSDRLAHSFTLRNLQAPSLFSRDLDMDVLRVLLFCFLVLRQSWKLYLIGWIQRVDHIKHPNGLVWMLLANSAQG